jgi:predicted amidohydrolase
MNIEIGRPDVNFGRALTMMEQAVSVGNKPDVIVLPEMWNTGYALDRIEELADVDGERTKRTIRDFCRRHDVHVIAGSIALKRGEDGGVCNTALVFDKGGNLIADYAKIHLFRLMEEDRYLTAGDRAVSFEIDGYPCGAMICYDIRFPELARKLAIGGAKMLFVPAEWPKPRLHHWRTLLQARAIENQMFVVSCNRVGTSGTTEFFGHSMIVDPWGDIVVEGGEEETILHAEVDLSLTERVRRTIPVFEDRRPSLY